MFNTISIPLLKTTISSDPVGLVLASLQVDQSSVLMEETYNAPCCPLLWNCPNNKLWDVYLLYCFVLFLRFLGFTCYSSFFPFW